MSWWFDSASTESGLQRTLNRFAAAYDTAENKYGQNQGVEPFHITVRVQV